MTQTTILTTMLLLISIPAMAGPDNCVRFTDGTVTCADQFFILSDSEEDTEKYQAHTWAACVDQNKKVTICNKGATIFESKDPKSTLNGQCVCY